MPELKTTLVVLGSGPGGYAAAFRAADLGLDVVLVERFNNIGGVCLNVGCIPSKTLLHLSEMCHEVPSLKEHGLDFGDVKINIAKVRDFKSKVVNQLTGGLQQLANARKVKVLHGEGTFVDANTLKVMAEDGETLVHFENCVIAAGSRPVKLPFLPDDERVLDSTSALELKKTDGKMLIIGGGVIGCEMGTVYNALGSEVCIVEMTDQIMPGADKEIVKPCQDLMSKRGIDFRLSTKVTNVTVHQSGLEVTFEGDKAPEKPEIYDQILVAVGRAPNGALIGADAAGVEVNERGFIPVDLQMRTNVSHIYAIGDICSDPMLAHKATKEGRLVAEVIAGKRVRFDASCIPNVAYTDPEVAWVGMTKAELKAQGRAFNEGTFPWMANGRSLCLDRTEGKTMVLSDKETGQVLGGGIVGRSAGDLIGVLALAIEMRCDIEDLELTIFPHPTMVETIGQASEMLMGTATDLIPPKRNGG